MCTRITTPEKPISSQGELKEEYGQIVMLDDVPYEPEVCLCPVDVERTLAEAGVDFEYHSGFNEYVIKDTEAS